METLRLLLLLLCGSPLSCAASWMWLGVASPGVPEQLGCSGLPLRPQQRELCRRKHFLLPSIQEGAQLAIAECQSQFRHERWNCSTRGQRSVFGHELSSGTRETAFIQAVMAAGLVHAVTRSCSQGNMTECGCAGRLEGGGGLGGGPTHGGPPTGEEEGEGWHWGGCSDQIQYGTWFSRRFLDGEGGNASTSGGVMMSRHNSEAGRQAVHRTMSRHCRCHGVSGSCGVKTCWRTMAPFGRVGAVLKRSYERSVQLAAGAPRWKSRRKQQQQQEGQRRPLPDGQRLVFLNKSPNYCVEDRQRGVAGTRGRRCSRSSAGAGGCNLLCCGRGYNTHLVRQVQRCHCKFVWCCYVRCRRCESVSDLYTCK